METNFRTSAETSHGDRPQIQRAFDKVKKFVAAYGAFSVAVILVVVILSVMGRDVSSFMWGRAGGMLGSAVVAYVLSVIAARGARWAYVRVCVICVGVPVAIAAIDIIPGALPPWFVAMQIAGAITLVPAVFILSRSELRAAFRK